MTSWIKNHNSRIIFQNPNRGQQMIGQRAVRHNIMRTKWGKINQQRAAPLGTNPPTNE
jgi:hypothetical protein